MSLLLNALDRRTSRLGVAIAGTAVAFAALATGCGDSSQPGTAGPTTATAVTVAPTTGAPTSGAPATATPPSAELDANVGPPVDQTPLGTFAVDRDTLDVSKVSAEVAAKANKVFGRYTTLIPAEHRPQVVSFQLLADTGGGFTNPTNDGDWNTWELGLGDEPDPAVLDHVIIHEFGHQLTLSDEQVDLDDTSASCANYVVNGGCSYTDSYINAFVDAYWPASLQEENEVISETGPPHREFWEAHKDEFVTEYAATQPAEDIAEVFAVFVTDDRPTGTTIADQKVQFFWDHPEAVALRTAIRTNLA